MSVRLAILLLALSAGTALAAETDSAGDLDAGWHLAFVPGSDLYPSYIADPRRAVFRFGVNGYFDSDISDAGDYRYGITLGGRYGIARLHREGDPDHGFQLDVEAAFIGTFDIDNSLDNIAWDGVYGALFSWRPGDRTAVRFGVLHDSSHVGDEFTERTGRTRVDYTREELAVGVSRYLGRSWRVYVEGGWAYEEGNDAIQDPWRLQAGVEYVGRKRILRDRFAWYVAADNESTEELDWEVRTAAQIGIALPAKRGARRFGLELFHGRSVFGEFFQSDETYAALAWWFDW
jgi:hypothetical protein